jgi:hypothetical protein
MSVKGSWARPQTINEEHKKLNYELAFGKITKEEYDKKIKHIDTTITHKHLIR